MGLVKGAHLYSNFIKLQPSYELKNIHLSRKKSQNLSLASCFFCTGNGADNSQLLFSGEQQLAALPLVSKKYNKLSQVEEKDFNSIEELKKGNINYPYKSPEEGLKAAWAEEAKITFRKIFKFMTYVELGNLERKVFERYTDILIIGGGAVGLSIAFAIKNKFPFGPKVLVVDKDDRFPHTSTNLSQGIVTQQLFTDEQEISILKYGAEFFSAFSRETEVIRHPEFKLPYDPLGTLILADSSNAEEVIMRNEKLKFYGIENKILDCKSLKKKFPWLNIDDVLFGSLGMINEGIIDPWAYLNGLKCKCVNLGVKFVTAEVIDFGCNGRDVKRVVCRLPDGTYNFIEFVYCVFASGLESLNLVEVLNGLDSIEFILKLPLEERMRYEYCFYNPDGPGLNTPTVISSDGTYFRRLDLTGHYVVGVPSVVNEKEGDPYHVFHSKVKPFLMKRTPALCKADLVRGWVDAYDFCKSNEVGIAGPHPSTNRFYFALGFSHLGLQYLPALGRAAMEFICCDEYQTIDFTPFHLENLWRKQHIEAEKRQKELLESKERIALTD